MNKLHVAVGLGALAIGVGVGHLAVAPVAVRAGYVSQSEVVHMVVGPTHLSRGSVSGARKSAGDKQFIGCTVSKYQTGVYRGSCMARDKDSIVNSCTTEDSRMVDVMAAVGPMSYIEFSYADGACTNVSVKNSSQILY
jgi:hypothetical protein